MATPRRICGNCAGWSAHDAQPASAACLRIPAGEENANRPVIRLLDQLNPGKQELAENVRFERPREFGCTLYVGHAEWRRRHNIDH